MYGIFMYKFLFSIAVVLENFGNANKRRLLRLKLEEKTMQTNILKKLSMNLCFASGKSK